MFVIGWAAGLMAVLGAFGGQQLNDSLVRASAWMTSHAETISAIVLAALGVVLPVNGIGRLRSL